ATCFSGRSLDEEYLTGFIAKHKLPCNSTTAFLTPALRNLDRPLLAESAAIGRPPQLYRDSFSILKAVAEGQVSATDVLLDMVRLLFVVKQEQEQRMESLLSGLQRSQEALPP